MNLGSFHSLVSSELKRGTSLDSLIPARTQMAARFLERNYTFQYMSRFMEIAVNASDQNPRFISINSTFKSVPWMRVTDTDGNYQFLKQIDLRDLAALETGMPSGYALDGIARIILDKTPDQNYTLETMPVLYTDWPSDTSAVLPLTDLFSDLLLAQTMMWFGNYLRDPDMVRHYQGMRNECIQTALAADQETRYDGLDTAMAYSPKYGFPSSD